MSFAGDVDSLKLGDDLPLGVPYAGVKYHFSSGGRVWWQTPLDHARVPVSKGHEPVLAALEKLGKGYGSFRVLPEGVVATKIDLDGDDIPEHPVFLTVIQGAFAYDADIDMQPADIKSGAIWTGFYDGYRCSFSADSSRAWWQEPESGRRRYWKRNIPGDLYEDLRRLKPLGGQFRITQHGYVITLRDLTPRVQDEYASQFDALSDFQQNLTINYIREFLPEDSPLRGNMMSMMPVYVGCIENLPELAEARDYSAPLPAGEKAAILDFLARFGTGIETDEPVGMVSRNVKEEELLEEGDAVARPQMQSLELKAGDTQEFPAEVDDSLRKPPQEETT